MQSQNSQNSSPKPGKSTIQALKVGSVVKVFAGFTNPPKYKRMIIVGSCNDQFCGVVLIDSNLNTNVHRNHKQRQFVIPFKRDQRRAHFLENDSFVDCTKIHPLSENALSEAAHDDPDGEYYGMVHPNDLDLIIKNLKANTLTIPNFEKTYFNI